MKYKKLYIQLFFFNDNNKPPTAHLSRNESLEVKPQTRKSTVWNNRQRQIHTDALGIQCPFGRWLQPIIPPSFMEVR